MVAHEVVAVPSVLSADFTRIADAIALAEKAGADWLHLDVMDGRFVPNITFGQKMVRDIRAITSLPLDTHLMIEEPDRFLDEFAEAGADHITFHIEACVHTHRALSRVADLGRKPGISIVPSTPVSSIIRILDQVFQVLVMTVNPGFGGQSLIPGCVEKVRELHGLRKEHGLSFRIAVDGGINRETAHIVRDAGADVLIAGSAFFSSTDPAGELANLRGPGNA